VRHIPCITAATVTGSLALLTAACAPSVPNSFAPANQPAPGSWTVAAVTYIARHPAPARPGMSSGIVTGFNRNAPEPPSTCPAASGCYEWTGTVVEAGGRTVTLSTAWSRHLCASLETLNINDYFSWSASRDRYGCPRSVIVIKRAAITARDVVDTTPLP
jgi:hypothetical protein